MKLIDQQKLLADLYTNSKIRDKYFIENKERLDKNEVTIFSESLVRKRLNVVKACLPLSFKIKGKLLEKLFIDYASSITTKGFHLKHQLDVFAFYNWLIDKSKLESASYLKEVLKYELFNLNCSMPGKKFIVLYARFRFPWATENNIEDSTALKGKVILFYCRFSTNRKGRLFTWKL